MLRRWGFSVFACLLILGVSQVPAVGDDEPTVPDAVVSDVPPPTDDELMPDPVSIEGDPAAVPAPTAQPAEAEPQAVEPVSAKPKLMIVGDSISTTPKSGDIGYNRTGHESNFQAWWAWLAERAGVDPAGVVVDARPSTGLIFGGSSVTDGSICVKYPFSRPSRLDAISVNDPDVLVIAGGRNDFRGCDAGGAVVPQVSDAALVEGFTAYLDQVADIADNPASRLDRRHVYVMAPWGAAVATQRAQVTSVLERLVRAHGFTWIQTPAIPDSLTRPGLRNGVRVQHDQTHPNGSGAKWLALQVEMSSNISQVLKGHDSAGVASGIRVACGKSTWCTNKKMADQGYYQKRRTSFWGRPAGGDAANYVAFRNTRGKGRYFPYVAKEPRSWLNATRATDGAKIVAVPSAGDIAWWPDAPSGVKGTGHVAIVTKRVNTYTVQVSELTGKGGWYRTTEYSRKNLPRAYLRLEKSDGSPDGKLITVSSPSRGKINVRGLAMDTDKYDVGARLRVRVYVDGKVKYTSKLLAASRFGFNRTVTVPKSVQRGAVKVRVYAYNAKKSKGAVYAELGTLSTTLK